MQDTSTVAGSAASRQGLYSLVVAYTLWGILPMYWKQLDHISSVEIICHRTLWALPFTLAVMAVHGRWQELWDGYRNRTNLIYIGTASLMHLLGWFIYVWGVNSGQILAVSLGQYILPLMSMAVGYVLFRSPLNRLQWVAVTLAASGVAVMIFRYGMFPWLSLLVASSSVLFAVLRKQAPVGVIPGMVMELSFNAPIGLGLLIWLWSTGAMQFTVLNLHTDLFLLGAGAVTAVPQLLYIFGLRRVTMMTLGFMQYILPTFVVLIGLFVYKEPFTSAHAVGFGCIWTALAIYSFDSFHRLRAAKKVTRNDA